MNPIRFGLGFVVFCDSPSSCRQPAIDNGIAPTLFRGETLRSFHLQTWEFCFAGTLALYAAIEPGLGAGLVFLAFLFELLMVLRRTGILTVKSRANTVVRASA